jgi:hypothetical protein
VRAAIESL